MGRVLKTMNGIVPTADGAGEAASIGKGDVHIQQVLLDLESYAIHHPRRKQTQGQSEKGFLSISLIFRRHTLQILPLNPIKASRDITTLLHPFFATIID